MNTAGWTTLLQALFRELVDGSPDPRANTAILNRGDRGLLASLDALSARAASAAPAGGASIAAHADHLRYGLSLLNRVMAGNPPPAGEVDFTASWRRGTVTEPEWRALRDDLRRETAAWSAVLGTPRELDEREAGWLAGSLPHLAYHMGAIRQIDHAARGPSAEEEARIEADLRKA